MTAAKIPKALAKRVRKRARDRCEYCLTAEWLTGQPGEIDHILPRAHGGTSNLENLCLACGACNGFKLDRVAAIDEESGESVPLFNPRTQQWSDHFTWSDQGTFIIGLSSCGRATLKALKMNRPLIVAARQFWVDMKRHPPQDNLHGQDIPDSA